MKIKFLFLKKIVPEYLRRLCLKLYYVIQGAGVEVCVGRKVQYSCYFKIEYIKFNIYI